jgi:hypothetical protein
MINKQAKLEQQIAKIRQDLFYTGHPDPEWEDKKWKRLEKLERELIKLQLDEKEDV